MSDMIKDAGMLRDEARFAMTFATPLLAVGFAVAIWHAIVGLQADAVENAVRGLMFGGPFIAMGWSACRYAAWRLEQAIAVEARRPIARKALSALGVRGAAMLRRLKHMQPELAARKAKCQQSLRLFLVGEPH
jgi:hypothetical protein